MKKNFYVCDSYHTETIAKTIKLAFLDSTISSKSPGFALLSALNVIGKNLTEGVKKKDEVTQKIDFFVLSAKLISDDTSLVERLKKSYGSNESIFIAVSTSPYYMDEVKNLVRLTESKRLFFDQSEVRKFFETNFA
jgi:hypothetical protein